MRFEHRLKKVVCHITDYLSADPNYLVIGEHGFVSIRDANTIPLSVMIEGYERTPPWLFRLNLRLPSRLKLNPEFIQEHVHCRILIIAHAVVLEDEILRLKERVNSLNNYQDIQIDIKISPRELPEPSSIAGRLRS
jgi:hypothetical protein